MKRFTETAKWLDPWFRKLPCPLKVLWMYFCDNCDSTGLIDFDPECIEKDIGAQIPSDWQSAFGDRVQVLKGGKVFISKFIHFQYGELSSKCAPHAPILKKIHERGLIKVGLNYQYPSDTLPSTLPGSLPSAPPSTTKTRQEEDKKGQDRGECEGGKNPNLMAAAAECDRLFAQYSKLPLEVGRYDRIWFDLLDHRFLPTDVEVYLRWVIHENSQREDAKYRTRFHVPKMFSDLQRFAADVQLAKAWFRNIKPPLGDDEEERPPWMVPKGQEYGREFKTAAQALDSLIEQGKLPKPK